MSNSRIPNSISLFNPYIRNTNGYLDEGNPTNWSRLGWTQIEKDKWASFLSKWSPLYSKYSNKKETRTTSIKDQLLQIIEDCHNYNKEFNLLDRIAASTSAVTSDFETFHIKRGILQDTTPTISQTSMKEEVFALLNQLGGGDMEIKCRTGNDSSRPSKPEGANCVQYAYQIGGTPPTSAGAVGLIKDISTKASFVLHLGPETTGQKLYIFFRWYNTKHPQLAGPWTDLQTKLIL